MAGQVCQGLGVKLRNALNSDLDQLKSRNAVLQTKIDEVAKDDVCLVYFEVVEIFGHLSRAKTATASTRAAVDRSCTRVTRCSVFMEPQKQKRPAGSVASGACVGIVAFMR